MKNRTSFNEFMVGLSIIHNREITESLGAIYWKVLEKYTDEECKKMFNELITAQYFPKPYDMIEYLTGGKDNLEDTAQIEATKVLQAIRRVGGGESVIFDDPVTTAVVRLAFNGWVQLTAELLVDNEKWFAKDFVKIYTAYARQGIKSHGHLPGIVEMNNIAKGYRKHIPSAVRLDKFLKELEISEQKQRQIEHGV